MNAKLLATLPAAALAACAAPAHLSVSTPTSSALPSARSALPEPASLPIAQQRSAAERAADLADNVGWFGGVAVGRSRFGGYELDNVSTSLDSQDFVFGGFAGYQAYPFWSVAVGYFDLGSLEASGPAFGGFEDEISVDGFAVTNVGSVPLGNNLSAYGSLGAFFWQQDVEYSDGSGPFDGDSSGVSPIFGAGVNWFVSDAERIGLNAGVHHIPDVGDLEETGHENDLTLFMFGVMFR